MTLLRPEWLWALLPLTLLLLLLMKKNRQQNAWNKVCDPNLLPHLLIEPDAKFKPWPLIWLALLWFLTTFALAGPSWNKKSQALYKQDQATLLLVDLSPGMYSSDLKPNRMARARYKITDLLKELGDGQVGVIAFAAEPYLVSPLNDDSKTNENLAQQLSPELMPVQGENTAAALAFAAQLFKQTAIEQGNIILITNSSPNSKAMTEAKQLKENSYPVTVFAIGTDQNIPVQTDDGHYMQDQQGAIVISHLDRRGLKQLANAGGGAYVDFTNDSRDIHALIAEVTNHHSRSKKSTSNELTEQWQDQGRLLLFFIMPLMLFLFRRGWLQELIK